MSQVNDRWGIELKGSDADKNAWQMLLKPPFDPFVEEIKDEQGHYLTLRSCAFDSLTTALQVHEAGTRLFSTLNVAMSTNADTDPITNGSVVEFVANGLPLKHRFGKAEGTTRSRGIVRGTATDAQGNVIKSPSAPSIAQQWMRAAVLKHEIGSALRYLEGKAGWVELYKAYEAIQDMPNGGISKKEIERFTRTANPERHHPNPKIQPHQRPMELWEARAFITQWVSFAIDDILAKNPM